MRRRTSSNCNEPCCRLPALAYEGHLRGIRVIGLNKAIAVHRSAIACEDASRLYDHTDRGPNVLVIGVVPLSTLKVEEKEFNGSVDRCAV
jgi:hypothetical protein